MHSHESINGTMVRIFFVENLDSNHSIDFVPRVFLGGARGGRVFIQMFLEDTTTGGCDTKEFDHQISSISGPG